MLRLLGVHLLGKRDAAMDLGLAGLVLVVDRGALGEVRGRGVGRLAGRAAAVPASDADALVGDLVDRLGCATELARLLEK